MLRTRLAKAAAVASLTVGTVLLTPTVASAATPAATAAAAPTQGTTVIVAGSGSGEWG